MYRRNIEPRLHSALADTPAVFLAGPRQVGKSTLARSIAEGTDPHRRYLTFDDSATLAAAAADPQGFIERQAEPVVLDEVQRVPAIFRAIKLAIDRERRPGGRRRAGFFFLTGSADPLLVPAFSDSLAGRIEIRTLWGLSQGEIEGRRERFIDRLFSGKPSSPFEAAPEPLTGLLSRALAGGYPEVVARRDERRRRDWLSSYVTALLSRDVRDLAQVDALVLFPRLLSLLALRSAGSLNAADVARDAGLPYATFRRYLALLEALHLVRLLPAWSRNATLRLVKAPKVLVTDSALAAHLAGWTRDRLLVEPSITGALLETFAGMELMKQLGWSEVRATLHWFRTHSGREVDFVLERDDGRLVGLEVKATTSLADSDFNGLRALAEAAGRQFHRGLLLYTGRESLAFGNNLSAAPLTALWAG
jgi:predicted AAA+ superfamily ATPase